MAVEFKAQEESIQAAREIVARLKLTTNQHLYANDGRDVEAEDSIFAVADALAELSDVRQVDTRLKFASGLGEGVLGTEFEVTFTAEDGEHVAWETFLAPVVEEK